MPAAPEPLMLAVLAVADAAGFIGAFVCAKRARGFEDLPTSRLRSAAQGYVELEGVSRLLPGPPIVCPLLPRLPSVWFRYKVEEKQRGEDQGWKTVNSGASDDCFVLEDETGRCIVDPTGARVIPSVRHVWYGYNASPDVSHEWGRGWWRAMWCTYRYTVELLTLGAPLYAVGLYRTQSAQADPGDEQAELRELLAKWKHDKAMMAMFDTNKDGHVDVREWEAARRAALAQVQRAMSQRAVESQELNILSRPRDSRPYVLSGIPQATLVRRYRLQAAVLFAAALAGSWMLIAAATGTLVIP